MRVILDMAISPNGMIAREDGREDWLPSEGWDEFLVAAKQNKNIVMGRETYDMVTKLYPDFNFDSVDTDLKVVVTRNRAFKAPEGYVVVYDPPSAIKKVEEYGLPEVFLIGGGKLNSAFIKQGLVDEIHLTLNPYIIGKGRSFVAPDDFDLPLRLVSSEVISGGRIAIKYHVIKEDRHGN